MERTVTGDKGWRPDHEFPHDEFKQLLGVTDPGRIWDVSVELAGSGITIDMGRDRERDERVTYRTSQAEFKRLLGIEDQRSVLIVRVNKFTGGPVQITMYPLST